MSNELDILKRQLERERKSRKAAEQTLEAKSLELYRSNEALKVINANLEMLVEERTRDLSASESRFRLIVETASDIIYRVDDYGRFTYANPTAIEKMGYSIEELKEMHFTDLVAPYLRQAVGEEYQKQWESNAPQTYMEVPVITRSGQTLWIGQNVIFIYREDGSVEQVNAVARDITDAKISQTRLRKLISTLQSGVLLEDESRQIALVNQTFCNMFGISASPDQLEGTDFSKSGDQSTSLFQDEDGFEQDIDRILRAQKQVLNDELKLKDGRIFERDYIPIFIDNHYSGHLWNYRDVTSQRNYVSAIQRSEEKYRGIIENMNLGLLEVDMDERIRYANQSFCEMSGFELDEILGKDASQMFVRGDHAEVMNEKNSLRTKGVSDAYEIATKNKRGEAKWWLISGAPLYDEHGIQDGSLGIHLDVTLQRELTVNLMQARKAAEASAQTKETFLANMSHEIRTPMNGIVGMARELSKTELDDPQQFYLNTIQSAADNLLVILNDILDLSKIEAGKLSVEHVSFDVRKTLEQAAQVMLPKAEEKGLQIRIELADDLPRALMGDPHRLNQVLLNLAGNAIKFTEHGFVGLSARIDHDRGDAPLLEIVVKDTGIGMEQEYLDKIFDAFSQEDRSTARKYGGTGLGLNISRQLVELMNGEIMVSSEKGKGTEFHTWLPLEEGELPQDSKGQTADYSILAGKRILVAEDNELNRLVIQSTLAHYHVHMEFAANGKEAIEILQHSGADLILMDVQMPVMDGLEATRMIKDELKHQMPIIALTANVLKGDRDRYMSAGMVDMVPKPFEEEQLLDVLVKWLGMENAIGNAENGAPAMDDANDDQPLYSLHKLEQISRGDEAFVKYMLEVFTKQCAESIMEFETALTANDAEQIKQTAHRMKPSVDTLEISGLREEIRQLEKEAMEAKNVAEIQDLTNYVIERFGAVLDALQKS